MTGNCVADSGYWFAIGKNITGTLYYTAAGNIGTCIPCYTWH
jgi:hypothetical protein